ncbi:hypothetical protein PHLGIDRAFT_164499 [Phlebiopsis gigantea 11061_1 CR5-6]|uniref:Uncharacterized protein n=1 Tax=Phlebiopsis gigantea (strain 11061_1 CR5-6) TaxID=745531 RepID=A0A0C3S4S7_PHLG1|nr:hypothetical protein PHLGIDRAFT_164499 [Phlebiopsis gigantea 11061_1 CR5-6]
MARGDRWQLPLSTGTDLHRCAAGAVGRAARTLRGSDAAAADPRRRIHICTGCRPPLFCRPTDPTSAPGQRGECSFPSWSPKGPTRILAVAQGHRRGPMAAESCTDRFPRARERCFQRYGGTAWGRIVRSIPRSPQRWRRRPGYLGCGVPLCRNFFLVLTKGSFPRRISLYSRANLLELTATFSCAMYVHSTGKQYGSLCNPACVAHIDRAHSPY